ncbi:MAG: endopeptidase La [Flavobacteriales bacterium]|nr:endopeptidase La [Flavobacteriales bacterium]
MKKFLDNQWNLTDIIDEDTEFIPLLTAEEEEKWDEEKSPGQLPILPLRNTVLFPGVVIPITVGRDKSIRLIKEAYAGDKIIGVVAQKDIGIEDPGINELNQVGTVAQIIKMLRMPDGNTTVIIQGKKRFSLREVVQEEPYLKATIDPFGEAQRIKNDKEFDAMVSSLKDMAVNIIKQSPNIPSDAAFAIRNIESPSFLINFVSSNMNAEVSVKQQMLEVADLKQRAELLLKHLSQEIQLLELKNQIQSKVKTDIDQQQREYFLHQQMKTIQEELGGNPMDAEIEEMRLRSEKKKWSKEIGEAFDKELEKLERMNPASAEYSVQVNYLDVLLDLPWGEFTKDNFNLEHAEKVLDADHYGMEKAKERVMEHLAVLKLKNDMKSPIICFYGPPGVGKTSLGKSIAKALGRNYVRISLGGLRDEAEIRGHRKTYIGAMPGRIIHNIKKAKSSNPVFVLDEIDKVGSDFHGDPSSALLEVLDPEQNTEFYDNYLEQHYDLSKVMFIATANSLSTIQPALLDRMEVIELSGYTLEEKIQIARKHLVPKQLKEHGLKRGQLKFPQAVLSLIVEGYTRESGVRGLEKKIAKVIRHYARLLGSDKKFNPTPTLKEVQTILGPPHFLHDRYADPGVPGVAVGLAWTSVGGDILFTEVSLSKGKGGMSLTGNLGDVMKESATIALEYLKSHATELGLDADRMSEQHIHVHVPEGATPKDGPSAGVTMLSTIYSALLNKPVRKNLAMTGEITLRGVVLPVGGIKEKLLAAKRANIKDIILPEENRKDVAEIPEKYLKGLKFHFVKRMEEVLAIALGPTKSDRSKTMPARSKKRQ